jgi:hypothetical protein
MVWRRLDHANGWKAGQSSRRELPKIWKFDITVFFRPMPHLDKGWRAADLKKAA